MTGIGRPRRAAFVAAVVALGVVAGDAGAHAHSTSPVMLTSPIEPFLAVALFDQPDTRWGPGHRGIDLAASAGTIVTTPGAGTVVFAGEVAGRGVVSIAHHSGLVSSIEPITATVEQGTWVAGGDQIGIVEDATEASHCAPMVCVHWGVRRNGAYVNPLDVYEGYGRVVLLPLTLNGLPKGSRAHQPLAQAFHGSRVDL